MFLLENYESMSVTSMSHDEYLPFFHNTSSRSYVQHREYPNFRLGESISQVENEAFLIKSRESFGSLIALLA